MTDESDAVDERTLLHRVWVPLTAVSLLVGVPAVGMSVRPLFWNHWHPGFLVTGLVALCSLAVATMGLVRAIRVYRHPLSHTTAVAVLQWAAVMVVMTLIPALLFATFGDPGGFGP